MGYTFIVIYLNMCSFLSSKMYLFSHTRENKIVFYFLGRGSPRSDNSLIYKYV